MGQPYPLLSLLDAVFSLFFSLDLLFFRIRLQGGSRAAPGRLQGGSRAAPDVLVLDDDEEGGGGGVGLSEKKER